MKLKNLFILLGIASFITLSSCGEDEADKKDAAVSCSGFVTDPAFGTIGLELANAAQAYSTNPDDAEACKAYVAAFDKYFAFVDPYVAQCSDDATFAQWKTAIDLNRQVNESLPCN